MAPRCRVCSKKNRPCADDCEYKPFFPKSMPKTTFETISDNYGYERFKSLAEEHHWNQLQQKKAVKSLLRENALRTLYPVEGMSMRVMQQQARIRQLKERVDFCDAYHWNLVQPVEGQPQQDNVQQFEDFLVDENGVEQFDAAALANMVLDLDQLMGNNDGIQEEQDLGLFGNQN